MTSVHDPKADAPRLDPDGLLTFVDDAALVRVYDAFLHRGGLPVRPSTPLQALENVTVRFGAPKIPLNAQVVMIQGEVTVLRLLEDLPETVRVLVEVARAKTHAQAAPAVVPPPSSKAPNAGTDETSFEGADEPIFKDDTLKFVDVDQASDYEHDVLSQLSVVTSYAGPALRNVESIYLAIGSARTDLKIPCSVEMQGSKQVRIQFSDIGTLAGAFRALLHVARQTPAAPVAKAAPETVISATAEQLGDVNDALAAFLADATPRSSPAAASSAAPAKTISTEAPAPASPVRDMFDVPPTGTEDELSAIVDAFDASPEGLSDIFEIGAPPTSRIARTDSLEISVSDLETVLEAPAPPPADIFGSAPVVVPPAAVPQAVVPQAAVPQADASMSAIPAAAAPPPAPAVLDGDVLKFRGESLAAVRRGFETLGLMWAAIPDDFEIDVGVEYGICIQVDATVVDAKLHTVMMPGPPGTALLRILDVASLSTILATAANDEEESAPTERASPAVGTLRGTSLAFTGIDELRLASQEIESTKALIIECLTTPPATLTVSANVSGASLGGAWPARAVTVGGRTSLKFDRPLAVIEAIALFLQAFDDATGPAESIATPTLSGHFIHFSHPNLATIAASEIEEHGAILVAPVARVAPDEKRAVRFQVAERPLDKEFTVRLQAAHEGKAIAFFDAKERAEASKILLSSLAAPSRTVGISPTDVAQAVLSKSGRVRNPSSPTGLLSIAIATAPRPADVKTPSIPLLLRLLMGGTGVVLVRFRQSSGERETSFYVDSGREVYASVPIAKLAANLAFQDGTYTFEAVDGVERDANKRMLMVSLIGETIRALVRRVALAALASGFELANRCPELNERGERLLDAVGFSTTQTRIARLKCAGTLTATEVVEALRIPLLGWELLYTLEVMGGLTWKDATTPAGVDTRAHPLELEWDEFQRRDNFDVLGLHWSTSPRHIDAAYVQAKERYAEGSPAAKVKPKIAAKFIERIEAAYACLKSPASRREYRKSNFALQWTQQSDLMLAHAKLATYRGDLSEARDLLEGILDFTTNAEASALLMKLEKAGLVK